MQKIETIRKKNYPNIRTAITWLELYLSDTGHGKVNLNDLAPLILMSIECNLSSSVLSEFEDIAKNPFKTSVGTLKKYNDFNSTNYCYSMLIGLLKDDAMVGLKYRQNVLKYRFGDKALFNPSLYHHVHSKGLAHHGFDSQWVTDANAKELFSQAQSYPVLVNYHNLGTTHDSFGNVSALIMKVKDKGLYLLDPESYYLKDLEKNVFGELEEDNELKYWLPKTDFLKRWIGGYRVLREN